MASNEICLLGLQNQTLYTEVSGALQAEENGSCTPALATNDILFGFLHPVTTVSRTKTQYAYRPYILSA